MDLRVLAQLIERVRREAVGAPKRVMHGELRAYEYEEQSATVIAMLKLVRAVHGVSAMNVLAGEGLMIDFGAAARGVCDSIYETYFLLEEHPKSSSNVDQFVRGFFETTITGFREARVPQVPTKKIRAAVSAPSWEHKMKRTGPSWIESSTRSLAMCMPTMQTSRQFTSSRTTRPICLEFPTSIIGSTRRTRRTRLCRCSTCGLVRSLLSGVE